MEHQAQEIFPLEKGNIADATLSWSHNVHIWHIKGSEKSYSQDAYFFSLTQPFPSGLTMEFIPSTEYLLTISI